MIFKEDSYPLYSKPHSRPGFQYYDLNRWFDNSQLYLLESIPIIKIMEVRPIFQ